MARVKPRSQVLQDGTVMLFGIIGDEFDGLDSKTVVSEIRDLGELDEINVLINSPGGSVFEGLAIYHELATNPAHVVVEVAGVAASMASAIAMAGDEIRIAKNGHMMIHDPWNVAVGDAEELRRAADLLDEFGTSLVEIYSERTGLPEDEIRDMMAEETWFTAEEALAKGFVDEVIQPVEAAAFAELDVSEVAAVPAALTRLIREGRKMAKTKKQSTPPESQGGEEPEGAEEPTATADPEEAQEPQGGGEPETVTDPKVQAAAAAAVRAERQRMSQIRALSRKHGLGDDWADEQIDGEKSISEVRTAALDALADRQSGQGPTGIPAPVVVGEDERDRWMTGMAAWLLVKSGQARLIEKHTEERPDPGEFRGFSLLDIARDALHRQGVSTRGMAPMEVARRALSRSPRADTGMGTRSDFPLLLENVLHKMLQAAYETAPDRWRSFAAQGSVSDFRDHPRYRLGSLPRLDKLLESGEFRQLHFPDAEKEVISADTHGNIIGLTRQAIVNDDLDGFARVVTMLGRAAARSIEIDVFALLEENSGLGPDLRDGTALFDASRNNISTPAGTPSVSTLEQARVDMAQQKDPNDNDFLDLRPAVWVGPIGLGADVRTAINAEFDFDSETSGNTGKFMKPNVVRDLLDTVVDTPRLSGDRWYLFADPDEAPVIEVVFLDGQESPQVETEEGFDYDGVRWRIRHDYGAGATDFRGAITNAGA